MENINYNKFNNIKDPAARVNKIRKQNIKIFNSMKKYLDDNKDKYAELMQNQLKENILIILNIIDTNKLNKVVYS